MGLGSGRSRKSDQIQYLKSGVRQLWEVYTKSTWALTSLCSQSYVDSEDPLSYEWFQVSGPLIFRHSLNTKQLMMSAQRKHLFYCYYCLFKEPPPPCSQTLKSIYTHIHMHTIKYAHIHKHPFCLHIDKLQEHIVINFCYSSLSTFLVFINLLDSYSNNN